MSAEVLLCPGDAVLLQVSLILGLYNLLFPSFMMFPEPCERGM
ncbi:hypothetical protein LEMLEM_LOCUS6388 [Lemmus lemmus]